MTSQPQDAAEIARNGLALFGGGIFPKGTDDARRYLDFAASHFHTVAGEVLRLTEVLRTAERLAYVPGMRKCAKCKCVLISANFHVPHGGLSVSADNSPQQCPNGCGPMWPVTERQSGNDLCDRLESAEARATALEAQIPTREQIAQSLASTVTAKRSYRGRPWMELEPVTREAFLLDADAILSLWNHQGGAR